jgi:hypothetical protein
MKIIATYDMRLDLGSGVENVLRGQEIEPPGTGIMNRDERARSLIKQGAAVLPADWPKHQERTESKHLACQAIVAAARKETDAARARRQRAGVSE